MTEAALQTIEHASQQSDRWLFIALLIVGGLSIGWLTRWFMQQLAIANQATAEAQKGFADYLQNNATEMIKVVSECRIAMHEMNRFLKENFEHDSRHE
jgi:hypothetical protein